MPPLWLADLNFPLRDYSEVYWWESLLHWPLQDNVLIRYVELKEVGFFLLFFHPLSSRGIFWLPIPVSPASTSTGRAQQTRWRTVKTLTRPPTSVACSLRPVYRARCHLLDWCQTTPWIACKNHQIDIMDKEPPSYLYTRPHTTNTQFNKEVTDAST